MCYNWGTETVICRGETRRHKDPVVIEIDNLKDISKEPDEIVFSFVFPYMNSLAHVLNAYLTHSPKVSIKYKHMHVHHAYMPLSYLYIHIDTYTW